MAVSFNCNQCLKDCLPGAIMATGAILSVGSGFALAMKVALPIISISGMTLGLSTIILGVGLDRKFSLPVSGIVINRVGAVVIAPTPV